MHEENDRHVVVKKISLYIFLIAYGAILGYFFPLRINPPFLSKIENSTVHKPSINTVADSNQSASSTFFYNRRGNYSFRMPSGFTARIATSTNNSFTYLYATKKMDFVKPELTIKTLWKTEGETLIGFYKTHDNYFESKYQYSNFKYKGTHDAIKIVGRYKTFTEVIIAVDFDDYILEVTDVDGEHQADGIFDSLIKEINGADISVYSIVDHINHGYNKLLQHIQGPFPKATGSEKLHVYLMDENNVIVGLVEDIGTVVINEIEWRPVDLLHDGGLALYPAPPKTGIYRYLFVKFKEYDHSSDADAKDSPPLTFNNTKYLGERKFGYNDQSKDYPLMDEGEVIEVVESDLRFKIFNDLPEDF